MLRHTRIVSKSLALPTTGPRGTHWTYSSYLFPAAASQSFRTSASRGRAVPRPAPGEIESKWERGAIHHGAESVHGWRSPEHGYPLWVEDKVRSSAVWIRDACPCPLCVSTSSGQKTFATADIPPSIKPRSVSLSGSFELAIEWENDVPSISGQDHVSIYPPEYLAQLYLGAPAPIDGSDGFTVPERVVPVRPWDRELLGRSLRTISFHDWMNSNDAVWQGLLDLESLGVVFVSNVPEGHSSIEDIALRIANMQETFYGRTWDVVSKPNAENVAYTNSYLGLHQDMLYLQDPPRIQLLHCMENSCEGGESIFSDGNRAALAMMRNPWHADHVRALSEYKVRYHYRKNSYTYRCSRPVFNLRRDQQDGDLDAALVNIWWSPPFQAPNPPLVSDMASLKHREWHRAMGYFQDLISDASSLFEYKMQAGECVIFDNRRVLHGRKAFDTGSGTRWLRGTYIADEDYRSKLQSIPPETLIVYLEERGLAIMPGLDDQLKRYPSLMDYLSSPA